MNKEKMLKLADFLEKKVAPEAFKMVDYVIIGGIHSDYSYSDDELIDFLNDNLDGHECGTSACIAGWTYVLFKDEINSYGRSLTFGHRSKEILDLDEEQAWELFFDFTIKSPLMAAEKIRKMVNEER